MEDNKIIGFNLSLDFGFDSDSEDEAKYNEIIKSVEDTIDDYFCSYLNNTSATLLSGKAELIRENNDKGICRT